MADPKIRIPIELPAGDMSGAEQAKRELDAVVDKAEGAQKSVEGANPFTDGSQLRAGAAAAAEEVDALAESFEAVEQAVTELEESVEALRQTQREADVDAAERIKAERELNEEMERTQAAIATQAARAAALGGIALVAKGAWSALTAAMEEYRRLAPDAADDYREPFDTIQLALQTIQSPIETLIEGVTGAQQSLKNLAASQAEAARQEAQLLETRARKLEELTAKNTAYVDGALARERQAIDESTAAYERQKNEVDALRAAQEAALRSAEDLAVANGSASPDQVAASRSAREQSAGQAGIAGNVADAEARAQQLTDLAAAAVSAYQRAEALNLDTVSKAREADAAIAARDQALLDLESIKEVSTAATAELASRAVSEQIGVVEATSQNLTAAAADAKARLEAEAAEQGKNFSAGGKEALKILTEALKDGVVTPEEMGAITVAIEQVRNSRDAADQEIKTAFENLSAANRDAMAALRVLNERSRIQAQEMADLRRQISSQP